MAMHEDDVPFAAERVDISDASLKGWKVHQEEGRYAVSGPCPACHGTAYGPALNKAPLPDDGSHEGVVGGRTDEASSKLVLAACECGAEHGEDGGRSCGRYWFVPVEP